MSTDVPPADAHDAPATGHEFADAVDRVAGGADAEVEARELVAALDTEELLSCLDGDLPFWPGLAELFTGGYSRRTWPGGAVERLGVPGIAFADGPRGCVLAPATAFPVTMARGASFDPDLERRVGEAIGAELRARGATFTGAVCMNLLRHPAWGRAQETYGEDPHHVGEMAVALTEGLQASVMACMKHFALNSMENARFKVDVTVDERALHEVYLPHFRRVAEAGVASVMSAYNSVNGDWCGENATLLRSILRGEWGWSGIVISDFAFGLRDPVRSVEAGMTIEMPLRQQRAQVLAGAVDDGTLDLEVVRELVVESVATQLRWAQVLGRGADLSIVAGPEHRELAREAATSSMVLLRNDGLLPLDPTSLRRVAVVGRLGAVANLGDHGSSRVIPPSVVTPLDGLRAALPGVDVVHHAEDPVAVDGADVAIVVIGTTKYEEGEFLDQSEMFALAAATRFPPMDHPTLGFPSDEARDAAFGALAGVGGAPGAGGAGEQVERDGPDGPGGSEPAGGAAGSTAWDVAGGDRRTLHLPAGDAALLAAVAARHERVVVCLMGGSAFVVPWLESVSATLMVWYPGMEGGHALADVLLGRVEPGGRLPFAIPMDEGDLVDFDPDADAATYGLLHGQWKLDADGRAPHLPFGHGLGYAPIAIGDEVGRTTVDVGVVAGSPVVHVPVRNDGDRPGSTVVQVYAAVPHSSWDRPPRRLIGFAKAHLAVGEQSVVAVPIDLRHLEVRAGGRWVVEERPITLHVGRHAGDDAAVLHTDLRPGHRSTGPI